jgi:hypothetical protein
MAAPLFGRKGEDDATTTGEAPTATLPAVQPSQPEQAQVEQVNDEQPQPPATPSWKERGRARRRLRYLRRARELALRDLGGLVFDLHRFGRERPDLIKVKLDALGALDAERRALEIALDDRQDVDVLREPGLASCPRCGALHASEDRFCASCGLPLGSGEPLPAAPDAATAPTPGP